MTSPLLARPPRCKEEYLADKLRSLAEDADTLGQSDLASLLRKEATELEEPPPPTGIDRELLGRMTNGPR